MASHQYSEFNHIINDNESGSTKVLEKLVDLLLELSAHPRDPDIDYIKGALATVKAAHPGLVVLSHFIDSFLDHVDSGQPKAYSEWLDDYKRKWGNLPAKIAHRLASQFDIHGKTVLVHSYSDTVVQALIELSRGGAVFRLIQTEARPVMEGRIQAQLLTDAGLAVQLIIDADAARYMDEVSCVILGADQYDDHSIANKTGSLTLTLLAHHFHKPVYVLADTRKRVASITTPGETDAKEIWSALPPEVIIKNQYFEEVPLELIRLITD